MNVVDVFNRENVRRVFRDVQKHRLIEQLIRRFSTNKDDIRHMTFRKHDFSNCRDILELGCAFGAFTEALKGRLHQSAHIRGIDIIHEYKKYFLEACRRADYEGTFSAGGVEEIKKYESDTFDLVLCSYALYFFPHVIAEIPRILREDGIFITITHSRHDMQELITLTKKILKQNALLDDQQVLPIEIVVGRFSAENGKKQLRPYFHSIKSTDFKNQLIFEPQEIDYFMQYFHFKKSFFLVGTEAERKDIVSQLSEALADEAAKDKKIIMSKNDRIFICSQPVKPSAVGGQS